ncbi:hypothetical protein HYALB_00012141 [Hymenoscyphus albidus]|uniref:Uncharacterized protein n=1 Tax=Hymenoscyphus albidus TaxID=595503 RepID=A0A9N9LJ78_9HELO|nr:hypothetical protein HYALB_00012141 [Hymenoscyphus albidus]
MDGTKIEEKKVENASEAAKGERSDDSDLVEKPVLDYGLGYGDFCFGHPWEWRRLYGPNGSFDTNVMEASNVVALPEITSFNRSGCFDFERLPIDIRRHFFRLLLAPLFRYNRQTRKSEFDFRIRRWAEWQDDPKPPTSRRGNYIMEPLLPKIAVDGVERTDYPFLEWIRKASNVSKSFRNVLADVLWERSSLEIDSSWLESTFGGFVQDRPAACAGVKELYFYLWCASGRWVFDRDQLGDSYLRFCSFASKLRLENLTVSLHVFAGDLLHRIEEIMAEEGDYATVGGTRQIGVSENFNLTMRVEVNVIWQVWASDSTQKVEDLEEKYQPMIRALMMPTSLAKKIQDSTTSEVGQYLRTRLG